MTAPRHPRPILASLLATPCGFDNTHRAVEAAAPVDRNLNGRQLGQASIARGVGF